MRPRALAAGAVTALAAALCGQAPPGPAAGDGRRADRERMVRAQLASRDITDARVLAAMRRVPRHLFVPPAARPLAYADSPLSIGHGQTISQPYIVALMSQLARVRPGTRALEVGTGSGYQAAVLHELGAEVWSVEIVEPLARAARARLARLGYPRVHVRHGDGYAGWPERAPFDAILLTAAPPEVPPPLLAQLARGGRLVAPVGAASGVQELTLVERARDGLRRRALVPVRFVPMTGRARRSP